MISKYLSVVSKKLKNEEIKTVIINFISLSSLNLLSFIFPLLLIPYLTRTIGVEYYGEYIFSFSIFQYCLLLINFGFDYSATKLISVNRDDKDMVSDVLTNVTVIRLIFALLASILLWLSFIFFPNLSSNKLLYLFGFGILWGQAITPFWLFQGVEKMGYITIINLLTRIVSTVLIFVFIRRPLDYYLINLFQSIGFLISGFASLFLINYYLKVQFSKPSFSRMKFYLLDSWHIFLSTVSMSFYREANIIILGLTTNYAMVGQYAAMEKVIKAMQSLMEPLSKALFPFFGRKLNSTAGIDPSFGRFAKIYGSLLLVLTITLYFIGPYLLIWYLGKSFQTAIIIFQVLLPVIFLGGLNYYLGIIGLINLGFNRYFLKAVFISGVTSVSLCYFVSRFFGVIGAAIAMSTGEFVLLFLILFKIYPWIKKQTS
ncbi:oligosaccharide flippase family protein [Flavobacterium sp. M31R6]|uniref:oligosaccharide flippase family protein n=1 Tax=Flavobacterium sp. M31R6 TaxID=2739062 RepID=UPI0015690E41|nr:oligosaccharide flippase family protein [Flavobacterium sp. M31R6]QKJ64823.1 oligosaccharide flippase family protein [Flavobacterium sp. M31R6]